MTLSVPGSYFRSFVESIEFTDKCWNWTGSKPNKRGYYRFTILGNRDYIHRWAYQFWVGRIRDGFEIHHTCENQACVRPEHLCQLSGEEHRRIHGLWEGNVRICPNCERPIEGDNAWHTNDRKLPRCRYCQQQRSKASERWRRRTS